MEQNKVQSWHSFAPCEVVVRMNSADSCVSVCQRCVQLGFPPDQNRHLPGARDEHIQKHLELDLGLGSTQCKHLLDLMCASCFGPVPTTKGQTPAERSKIKDQNSQVRAKNETGASNKVLCPDCGKYYNMCYIERHLCITHRPNMSKDHTCPDCGKSFKSKSDLWKHRCRVRQGFRPYACSECPKRYINKDVLEYHHQRIHSKEKFDLVYGDLSKKSGNQLNQLKKTMDKEKQKPKYYACLYCDKSFKDKNSLWRHRRHVHERYRPHRCTECPKQYCNKIDLKKHQLQVHSRDGDNQPPWTPPICSKRPCTTVDLERQHPMVEVKDRMEQMQLDQGQMEVGGVGQMLQQIKQKPQWNQ